MSDYVFNKDGEDLIIVGRGRPAWHRKGKVYDGFPTVEELIEDLQDVRYRSVQALYEDPDTGEVVPAPGFFLGGSYFPGDEHGDRFNPLVQVKEGWSPIQLQHILRVLVPVLEEQGAGIDTAGLLYQGEHLFLGVSLPEVWDIDGDRTNRYVTANVPLSGAAYILGGGIRQVCHNTMMFYSRRQDAAGFRIAHTGDIDAKAARARQAMGTALQALKDGEKTLENFLEIEVPDPRENPQPIKTLLSELFDIKAGEELSSRKRNTLERWFDTYFSGCGAQGFPERQTTLKGFVDTTVEFVDHRWKADSGTEKAVKSILFGEGERKKRKAMEIGELVLAGELDLGSRPEVPDFLPDDIA